MVSLKIFVLLVTLLVVCELQQASSKLVFVQSILRHGARNPYQILGIGDQYVLEQHSVGELTTQGKAMHYYLGKKMYELYWKRLFGGTKYEHIYHPSRFWVQSTNVSRTVESAQSHIYGLLQKVNPLVLQQSQLQFSRPPYPNAQAVPGPVYGKQGPHVHPIPVHINGRHMSAFDSGDYLTRFLEGECPNQGKWQKDNFETKKHEKMLSDPKYLDAMNQLSKALGKPMDVKNFTSYYDNLQCMLYRGKQVPQIFSKPSQVKSALDSLYSLSSFIKFYSGEKQIRASANDLINRTINNMKKVIKNIELSEQWVIYSAHDITIGIALAIMDMWNADCIYESFKTNQNSNQNCVLQFPTFAASLVFQLYQSTYNKTQYTFKINYNGQHKKIPFCGNKQECDFQTLTAWFNTWQVEDVKLACGAPNYYTKQTLILLGTALLVTIIYALIMRVIRGNEEEKTKKQ